MPTCITCTTYRPDAEPRLPNLPPVCDGDRQLLDRHLGEIAETYHRLTHPEPPDVDGRAYVLADRAGIERSYLADPLSALGGAGPVPGESVQPRVSGSPERPAPLPLDQVDLALPARHATRRLFARGRLGMDEDQVGTLSVATILDTWVRDWRDQLWPDHHLPVPTVAELVAWLRKRVEDACDKHPAIDEFADEIKETRSALHRVLGEIPAQPETERYKGVTCRRCDMRALYRRPGDTYIECGNCGQLLTEDEYADWRDRLAGYHRSTRTSEELAELMRASTRPEAT